MLERFWDMFIVDALIRKLGPPYGNRGFLYDDRSDEVTLAPVYDCGSCLYPQADETILEHVLTDRAQLDKRIYDIPLSAINVDGKKIRYFDFISSPQYEGCNEALKRTLPRIDMEKIGAIIEQTPFISDLQKRFYMTMLTERKAPALRLWRRMQRHDDTQTQQGI